MAGTGPARTTHPVMPGLEPGIQVFARWWVSEDVDGRDGPGHDGARPSRCTLPVSHPPPSCPALSRASMSSGDDEEGRLESEPGHDGALHVRRGCIPRR